MRIKMVGSLYGAPSTSRRARCGCYLPIKDFWLTSRSSLSAKGIATQLRVSILVLLFCVAAFSSHAALQFDVFLGYDSIIPEASWFPMVCEIKNDGPSFNGTIELTPGNYNPGQTRRVSVELPTGTLKRLVIPVFSASRGYSTWDIRLLDERGKVRSEQTGLRARKQASAGMPLVGALARTAGGVPVLAPTKMQQADLQPSSARLQPPIFPDNPLVLEGMDTLYLNSEKASDLRATQVEALHAWLHAGGHLIIAVEQIGDVTGTPWLKNLFPCELKEARTLTNHIEFQNWLKTASSQSRVDFGNNNSSVRNQRNRPITQENIEASNPFADLPDHIAFEATEMQIMTGSVREGEVVVQQDDLPLVVTASRGRGRVSALMFSPEREPFRTWKNLPAFWAKLAEVPGSYYVSNEAGRPGGWSSDGIFGAMLDSKQVHKLPVEWLLLLLIVYLVVIGPLDQFWLKKIGRPMLTWITFPCYVVFFSLLIYFIGYKLRAGESEWNEIHLVDVLSSGTHAELRGRTYASVYSPSNQRYTLEGQQKFSTLRGEFVGNWGGGQSSEKATVLQSGDNFKAEIFVPVWTSQLFVNDWWQPASPPLNVAVTPQGDRWSVKAENRTDRKLTDAKIIIDNTIMNLGEISGGETKTVIVSREQGSSLNDFVFAHGQNFQSVAQSRFRAFGGNDSGQIGNIQDSTIAVSFLSLLSGQRANYMNNFISPPGLDMSAALNHGQAVVFAWASDYSPVKPMYQFSPKRSHRNTMFRLAVPIGRAL